MQLKKPKVKVKKSSQPKPSSRIVAKVKTRDMPEIQLPDLMGTGEGLLGGTGFGGEFLDLPEIGELSAFGSDTTTGNDLVGRFYDFKRTGDGRIKPISREDVDIIIRRFFDSGWNTEELARKYYRSPKRLYANCICIGTVQSMLAPQAFGEYETEGWAWAVVYQGKLVYPEDIRFRFRGVGDKLMAVRVDGEMVMLCAYQEKVRELYTDLWYSRAPENRVYPMGEDMQSVGDWIELKAGEPKDIQILISDREGGLVYHQIAVEVEGEEYPRNPFRGGPTCPVFKLDNLTREQIDTLYMDVYPGDVCLTNGPVFCDYFPKPINYDEPMRTNPPAVLVEEWAKAPRTWTAADGKTVSALLLLQAEDYVLLEQEGRQHKLPKADLSEADRRFLEMADPPELKIEYSKTSDQINETRFIGPYIAVRPSATFEYTFGAKVKQASSGDYNHPLTVEYFAIGEQINDSDKYILLDHRSKSFVPSKENNKSLEFYGKKVRLRKYSNRSGAPFRGRETGGYLIVVYDSEGRIVQYKTSNEFLFRNLEKLKQLPINAFFDKNVDRAYPTRPTDADRGPGAQK
jgi:hypothetical protein